MKHEAQREDVMVDKELLVKIDEKIQAIKKAALELRELSNGIQAVERNADRILASTKMLEINISDVLEILEISPTRGHDSSGTSDIAEITDRGDTNG
jgi:hypothetical protein